MALFKKNTRPNSKFDVHRTLPQYYTPDARKTSQPTHINVRDDRGDRSKSGVKRWLRRSFLTVFLLVFIPGLIIMGLNARNLSQASKKIFDSGNLFSLLVPSELDSNNERVNVLVTGYSADDPGHAAGELTDSILILSLDKKTKTGYTLSIPRDLYVNIPGSGYAKINEAYQDGKRSEFSESGYPAGGMGLLEKTIESSLGLEIHYYALINYATVRDLVAALDGITVNIESNDSRGIYDPNFQPNEGGPLKLPQGTQEINASQALRLTRARGSTAGSYGFPLADFDRTKNQREVLRAIKAELSLSLLLNPFKNKPIFNAVAENVETDLTLNESLALFRLFNSVPEQKLKPLSLRGPNTSLLQSYRTRTGQAALIPNQGIDDYSEIREFINSQP